MLGTQPWSSKDRHTPIEVLGRNSSRLMWNQMTRILEPLSLNVKNKYISCGMVFMFLEYNYKFLLCLEIMSSVIFDNGHER